MVLSDETIVAMAKAAYFYQCGINGTKERMAEYNWLHYITVRVEYIGMIQAALKAIPEGVKHDYDKTKEWNDAMDAIIHTIEQHKVGGHDGP